MSEWFIARGGAQEGPLTAQQISDMLAKGELRAGEAHAWKEGLPDWKPLAESGVLAEASMSQPAQAATPAPTMAASPAMAPQAAQQPRPVTQPAAVNPYTGPAANHGVSNSFEQPLEYPGIGRLAYFGLQFVLTIVLYAVLFLVIMGAGAVESIEAVIPGFLILMVIGLVGGLFIAVKRVQNIGMSGWAVLWSLVPIISIWISWRMIACPAGYEHHRQLDTAGKVISGLMIGLFALGIVANIFVAATGGGSSY